MTQQLIDAAKALLDSVYLLPDKAFANARVVNIRHLETLRAAVEAAEKQPAQEPVGEWVSGNGMPKRIVWSDGYVANANVGDEIYAAPAAQQEAKPLREAEVSDLRSRYGWAKETIRAIEAALGIGVQK